MTSASELFHIRRHRLGRNSLDLGFLSSSSQDLHHHDLHSAQSLRRHHHHARHLRHRERASDRTGTEARNRRSLFNDSGDGDSAENVAGTFGVGGSERLPVGVQLARARLLQRLRGESVSRNRDSTSEDLESELSSEVSTGGFLVSDLTSQMGRSQLLQELNKKPPGLTQEALNSLHREDFSSRETGLESGVPQVCGICLESFKDGDELIRLPCGHKFHSACLDPWVRCCGDCPYCRRCIVVNNHLPQNEDCSL